MSSLPDFEAWAIFAKVADARSFSRAADDLGLSKATVSKAVARLEARLGMPLFHRSSRRMSLTEGGLLAVERAQRLLADGEAIEEALCENAGEARGTVRLAVPMSFGIQHLGAVLPEFLARHPGIAIDLDLSDHQVDLVGGGYDLALRIGTLADSSLRARRLFAIRRPLVAAPAYLDRHGRPSHPRDLERGHRAITYSHLAQPHLWRFDHPTEGDYSVRVTGPLSTNNGDVVVPMVVAGLGLTLAPEFLVWRELASGRLVEVMQPWTAPATALHLVTPPGRLRPQRVRLLMEFLASRFLTAPWAHESLV